MTTISTYSFEENEITAMCITGEYFWVAYQGSGGNSILHKKNVRNPNTTYYEITVPVDKIVRITADTTYIYLAVEDDTYIAYRYKITNPLTVYKAIAKPITITENPVDIAIDSNSYFYLLVPGTASGTYATVLKYISYSLSETIELSESGKIINDARSITVDDNDNLWIVTYENPTKLVKIYDDILYSSESLEGIYNASKIIHVNPLVIVCYTDPVKIVKVDISGETPVEDIYVLNDSGEDFKNATDICINEDTDMLYISCEDGKIIQVELDDFEARTRIDTGDTDNLTNIVSLDDFNTIFAGTDNSTAELIRVDDRDSTELDSDLRFILQETYSVGSRVDSVNGLKLNSDFRFIVEKEDNVLNSDIRFILDSYYTDPNDQYVVPPTPIATTDFIVYFASVERTDVDLTSIKIVKTADDYSTATFKLALKHDNFAPVQTAVLITLSGNTIFEGTISKVSPKGSKEELYIEAQSDIKNTQSVNLVNLPLASSDTKFTLYDVFLDDINIYNPVIEDKYLDDDYEEENDSPPLYNGVKIDLGSETTESVTQTTVTSSGVASFNARAANAVAIWSGEMPLEQNWTYFFYATGVNVRRCDADLNHNFSNQYIGTSLSSLSDDIIYPTEIWWEKQREWGMIENVWETVLVAGQLIKVKVYSDDDDEGGPGILGWYKLGSAPYLEVSARNGRYITATKYSDEDDGLYTVRDEGYDYTPYTKLVAGVEYEKIKNINGDILPQTSASIGITIDAMFYYNIEIGTKINLSNTTQAGIFKDSNGFPLMVKSISIDSNNMKISLTCDNKLTKTMMDDLDDTLPDLDEKIDCYDENGFLYRRRKLYVFGGTRVRLARKFDPVDWKYVE